MSISNLPVVSTGGPIKPIWQRPEGNFAKGGLAVAIAVGLGLLWKLGPTLVEILMTGVHIAWLAGILVAIVLLVANPRFRTLVRYIFESLVRFVAMGFIEVDPIGVLENRTKDMVGERGNLKTQRDVVDGQVLTLTEEAKKEREGAEQDMKLADIAGRRGEAGKVTTMTNDARRREDNAKEFEAMAELFTEMRDGLDAMLIACDEKIADATSFTSAMRRKRKTMGSAYSAFMSVQRILSGSSAGAWFYDRAAEVAVDDFNEKLATFRSYVKDSSAMVSSDLLTQLRTEQGQKALSVWRERSSQVKGLLSAHSDASALPVFRDGRERVPASRSTASAGGEGLQRLFDDDPNNKK